MFYLDDLAYLTSSILWFGKCKENRPDLGPKLPVTVLIPVHRERREVVEATVRSVKSQTVPTDVWILMDYRDNVEEMEKLAGLADRLIVNSNSSKAEAINRVTMLLKTRYTLIIDAGDRFSTPYDLQRMLGLAESKQLDAVTPVFTTTGSRWWQKLVRMEMHHWTSRTLPLIKRRFGFYPLPGTGLLMRSSVLQTIPFPNTLAEDATMGLFVRNAEVCHSAKLIYNLPDSLAAHLKQRARWMAGYLQSIRFARGREKLVYCLPVVQGLVPVSVLTSPFVHTPIDPACLGLLVIMVARTNPIIPFWWFVAGFSFYLSLYYASFNRWYHSPKVIR